jgi:hypothetical protein
MGEGYLIDTNILNDAQAGKLPRNGLSALSDIINQNFTVSFITYIEYLGYKQATEAMQGFMSMANVIEVNKSIIDTTIALRKAARIQLPDAIVAATALVGNRTLVTRNVADFKNINGLRILNLWEL